MKLVEIYKTVKAGIIRILAVAEDIESLLEDPRFSKTKPDSEPEEGESKEEGEKPKRGKNKKDEENPKGDK
jgi:hypothetical protein